MKQIFTFLVLLFFFHWSFGQIISGTVSDYYSNKPLDAVSVQTSSGNFSISDSLGRYKISVSKKDSVWFSYLNKQTMKYSVDTIMHPDNFDVALYVDVRWLPEVTVATRNYRQDSIQNRIDYAKAFNYRKPGLHLAETVPSSYSPGGLTVGFNLDDIIDAFRFKRNREMLSFQQRLIQQEHDKYVDHRYTKYLVKRLTGLDSAQLISFMDTYRPPYEAMLMMNDLELGYYIEQCYKDYMLNKEQN